MILLEPVLPAHGLQTTTAELCELHTRLHSKFEVRFVDLETRTKKTKHSIQTFGSAVVPRPSYSPPKNKKGITWATAEEIAVAKKAKAEVNLARSLRVHPTAESFTVRHGMDSAEYDLFMFGQSTRILSPESLIKFAALIRCVTICS